VEQTRCRERGRRLGAPDALAGRAYPAHVWLANMAISGTYVLCMIAGTLTAEPANGPNSNSGVRTTGKA
jgi:hypothetical protein